jgi:hypothetical protein
MRRTLFAGLVLCLASSASAGPKPKTLRYRSLYSSEMAPGMPERIATYVLTEDGASATLTIEKRERTVGEKAWKQVSNEQLEGSRKALAGGAFSLELAGKDGRTLKAECTPSSLKVAAAGARMRAKRGGECDAAPVWSLATLTRVKTFACKVADVEEEDPVIPPTSR